MLREYNQVLRYGFGMLALVAGFLLTFFLAWSYPELQPVFATFNADKPWLNELVVETTHTFGISETVYLINKTAIAFLFGLSLLALYRLQNSSEKNNFSFLLPTASLSFYYKKFRERWKTLPAFEKKLLAFTVVLFVVVRIYLLHLLDVEMDEAYTYYIFLRRELPGVLMNYAIPNNHVLYSLLCLVVLPVIQDPYWVVKIPSLLVSALGLPVLYLALRSLFRFSFTYFAAVGFGFSQYLLYYSVHGRGYSLLVFLAAVAFIAILKIYESRQDAYWLAFLSSVVAGFYTIPVFLYAFASISVFAVISFVFAKNYLALCKFLLVVFFAGTATLLLYLPILLVSGPKLLFENVYVIPLPYITFLNKFLFYFKYTQGTIIGQESIGFFVWLAGIFCLVLLLLIRKKAAAFWSFSGLKPVYLVWILCCTLVPWFIVVAQGVLPRERIWTYKTFPDFLVIGILLQVLFFLFIRNRKKLILALALTLVGTYGSYELVKVWRNNHVPYTGYPSFFDLMAEIRQQPKPVIFTTEDGYKFFLRYEFLVNNGPEFIADAHHPDPARNYNVLILSHNSPAQSKFDLEKFRRIYADNFVSIYFLNWP